MRSGRVPYPAYPSSREGPRNIPRDIPSVHPQIKSRKGPDCEGNANDKATITRYSKKCELIRASPADAADILRDQAKE